MMKTTPPTPVYYLATKPEHSPEVYEWRMDSWICHSGISGHHPINEGYSMTLISDFIVDANLRRKLSIVAAECDDLGRELDVTKRRLDAIAKYAEDLVATRTTEYKGAK